MLLFDLFHRCFEIAPDGGQGGSAIVELPPGALSPEDARKLRNDSLMDKIKLARLQAIVEFPKADRELVEMFSGSPEEIRAFAEKLQARAETTTPSPEPPLAPAPTTAPQVTHAGPPPIPGPGEGAPPESEEDQEYRRTQAKIRSNRLRTMVDPAEVENFGDRSFVKTWNQHMQDRKSGRSSVSAGNAPPVVQ